VQAEWARGWMKGVGVGRVSEIYPLHFRGIYIRGTLEVEWAIWVLSHSALYSMPRYPTLDHSKAKHARNHQLFIHRLPVFHSGHAFDKFNLYVSYRPYLQIIYIAFEKNPYRPLSNPIY